MVIEDPEILNDFLESTFQEIKLRFRIMLVGLACMAANYNEDTDSVDSREHDVEENGSQLHRNDIPFDELAMLSFQLEQSLRIPTPRTPTNTPEPDYPSSNDEDYIEANFTERCSGCNAFHDMDTLFGVVKFEVRKYQSFDWSENGELYGQDHTYEFKDNGPLGFSPPDIILCSTREITTDKDPTKPENINCVIYVENVNPISDADELKDHFKIFGPVRRALLFLIKQAGFAQIEFVNEMSMFKAMRLNNTIYKGYYIRVYSKIKIQYCRGYLN